MPNEKTITVGRVVNLENENRHQRKQITKHFSGSVYQVSYVQEIEAENRLLKNENERLKVALADAIRCPLGVVPDSAIEFLKERNG